MELSDLSVFCKVVETGGISAAAAQLHRVPSNITARIQKLENEIGLPLFIREKNRLRISSKGQELHVYAQKILLLADEALNQLQQDEPSGLLKIGTMEAVAATHLSSKVLQLHQQFPQVQIDVSTKPTDGLIEKIISGHLDVALVAGPVKDERLMSEPAFKEKLVLISSLKCKTIEQVKTLARDKCLLGFDHGCAYRKRLQQWAREMEVLSNIQKISSYHTLLTCVASGMGIGIAPKSLINIYPFKEDIKIHQLPKHLSQSQTELIWRKDNTLPSINVFSGIIKNG